MAVTKKKKKKKRMGRPPKAKVERRVRFISIRLNDAEYAALEEAANGFPVHTWARVNLLKLAGVGKRKK